MHTCEPTGWLQKSLNHFMDAGLKVDNKYGNNTIAAVKKFGQLLGEVTVPPKANALPSTKHFTLEEYARATRPRGLSIPKSAYPIILTLFNVLEEVRREVNALDDNDSEIRLTLTHTGRSKEYHAKNYSYSSSMHCEWGAADIVAVGISKYALAKVCWALYQKGVIGGFGFGKGCIHIDIRHRTDLLRYDNRKSFWCYDKNPKTGKKFTSFNEWYAWAVAA